MIRTSSATVVVGIDNGGTTNNATVLSGTDGFLVDRLVELPSRVQEGPQIAVQALVDAFHNILDVTGVARDAIAAVGLDTPGPASATGVISSRGSTNFAHPEWRNFDVRRALELQLQIPVVYTNDANAAGLYAHHAFYGAEADEHSSAALIVGTGLGGAVVEAGHVLAGRSGMAGEFGHIPVPLDGMLGEAQPVPVCNCGLAGDAESFASLTGIAKSLLPYWLTRFPGHPLVGMEIAQAAKEVRGLAEAGDPLALKVFEQQAMALGRVFHIVSNVTDPDTFFVGGGVVETAPHFRDWFLQKVREHTSLRDEQAQRAQFALVPDLDMAGARGSAIAALDHATR